MNENKINILISDDGMGVGFEIGGYKILMPRPMMLQLTQNLIGACLVAEGKANEQKIVTAPPNLKLERP